MGIFMASKIWKKVSIEAAIGMRLAHDMTQIIPGQYKGAAFRKGQIVRKKDIPRLLDLGKKQIYVLQIPPGALHENDAARRIARAVAGKGLALQGPREGKINFVAKRFGFLKVNGPSLKKINAIGDLIVATRHHGSIVGKGELVAGTRAIPLVISKKKIEKVESIAREERPILQILPLRKKRVGILVTGSELYEGRIKDRSAGVVRKKVEALGSRVIREEIVPDNPERIASAIQKMKAAGCRVIVATGGLSVDPDDVTLEGIKRSGAKVIFYGAPVLPGSMFALAYLGRIAILGAPACVIHDLITALDLFLPPVLAEVPVTAAQVAALGHGGLCLRCPSCQYPVCPFGKGDG
jgi:molybdenum cofactor synthesis domain-containing protein